MSPTRDAGPHDFSLAKVPASLRFALASARRRWPTFLLVSAGMVALAAGALAVSPRTYQAECRLLVRADPGSTFEPSDVVAGMAWISIRRHDNLQRLIQQTDLAAGWPRNRAPLRRLEEWIRRRVGTPVGDEEALTALLERRLVVWSEGGGVVHIRVHWEDPVAARRLVEEAQRGYIETMYRADVGSLAEAIPVMEKRAGALKKDLESRVAALRRLESRSAPALPDFAPRAAQEPPAAGAKNVGLLLEANRRAIEDLEVSRERTLAELTMRLADQRAVFSEAYPGLADTRRRIAAFGADSPRLLELRQQEAELSRQLAENPSPEKSTSGPAAPVAAPPIPAPDRALDSMRMDAILAARKYTGMLDDIAALRLRLEIAGTAFQRRYVVVIPPEVAAAPIWPDARRVMIAAVIDAIVLGVFATTAVDLRRGGRRDAPRVEGPAGRGAGPVEIHQS